VKKTCKRCNGINVVNNGKVRGKQRYKCKDCGYNFIEGDSRGKIRPEAKALALLLYGSGKASYGMIARLFNVSRTAVLYWIKAIGKTIPEPVIDTELKEIQIDEMWHFINKKNKKYGSGEPWIVLETKPSDGILAIVMLKRLSNSLKR
jgi:transposase